MEILTAFARGVRMVLGIDLMSYVVLNGSAHVIGLTVRQQVAGDVSAMLERIVPSAIRSQDELANAAGREPDRRWIEQRCEFGSDDSGWIAIRYREICVMRSVTAWNVDSEHEARALLPVREVRRWSSDGCITLGPVGDIGVVESPEATYVNSLASDGDPWCTTGLNDPDGARAIVGRREEVGPGRWLVVVAEQPLVDVPIGCVRWTIVLCHNPWGWHAYGDWSPPTSWSARPVARSVEAGRQPRRGVAEGGVDLWLGEEEGS